ncbi:helix-turn-helix domain-containing protein [Microbacterium phyllosphaerae]|uniref:helix-turn-helix domain-containing protein n=1 Tax=Microbacterium phyllosphaerae TaxID=124798 RepID=UPI00216AA97E|nr:helix-turn-helix domain-containing protein [Microbacterium phyllosphaerae]MCS3442849.1 DNA-binding IclR family transcriptional regulator [Microbacterium phyllosphaerae]
MTAGDAVSITARQPAAIHSALSLLEAVAAMGAGVTARQLAERLGMPRATTYRLLNLLVQDEYLVRTPDLTGFALGTKVALLAGSIGVERIPRAARDVLERTRESARGGIHLVLYRGDRVVVADEDPDFPLSNRQGLQQEPTRYALGLLPLVVRGETVADDLVTELRSQGVIRARDGQRGCLAAPITDASGTLAGALSYSGPRRQIDSSDSIALSLVAAARELGPLLT